MNRAAPQLLSVILVALNFFLIPLQARDYDLLPLPPLPQTGIKINAVVPQQRRTKKEMIEAISQMIARKKTQLADPKLRPKDRDKLEKDLAKQEYYLLQYQTNASFGVTYDNSSASGTNQQFKTAVTTNEVVPNAALIPIPHRIDERVKEPPPRFKTR